MAETTYTYTRSIITITFTDPRLGESVTEDVWDIERLDRTGGVRLANEIDVALPGKLQCVKCHGDTCNVVMKDALSAGDKLILDGLISDHKSNR